MDSFENISNSSTKLCREKKGSSRCVNEQNSDNAKQTSDNASVYRSKALSRASLNWSYISKGIEESLSLHMKTTVFSLPDLPSANRVTSAFQMSINLQSMILGTSVLSLPYCLKIAGIWSLLVILVIGLLTTFTALILSDCQYQESFSQPQFRKRVNVSFVDMAKACWKNAGCYVMEVIVYLSLLRNIVVMILLTDISAELLQGVIGSNYDKRMISIFWAFAILPMLFIKKIKPLTCLSFAGLNFYLIAITSILVLCCLEASKWDIHNIALDFNLKGLGITIGIVVNSFAVHLNLPPLEGSLKNEMSYQKSVNGSFIINICAKMSFALCGYLTCLEKTGQEITNEIRLHTPLPLLVRGAVLFFAFFSIPLQNVVVLELIDDNFRPYFPVFAKHPFLWVLLTRCICITASLFVTVSIPHFSIVVSLIGSLRGSLICLILPPMFYLTLDTLEKKWYKNILCYITLIIGILAAAIGSYSSVAALFSGVP